MKDRDEIIVAKDKWIEELLKENEKLKDLLLEALPVMESSYLKKSFFDEANKILKNNNTSS